MTSGIYKLVFPKDYIYIGKSVDIEKRWDQHLKALKKGTHTARIQEAYNKYGIPKLIIISECHPHHIDILETYYINGYWSDKILNSTRPADIDDLGLEIIDEYPETIWDLSTFEIINKLQKSLDKIEELNTLIAKSKNAQVILELQEELASLNNKVYKLSNRGFFARLFNWYK